MRKSLAAAICLTVAIVAGPIAAQTVIVVRHAEKMSDSGDPPLSEAGQARAQALAEALRDAGITHVVTTSLRRTIQTGAPTAQAAAVVPTSIDVSSGGAAHIAQVAGFVQALPDEAIVLVVGHSNTVPEIARALGDPEPEMLTDCDYDRLVVLTLHDEAAPHVIRGRYGAPSEAC